MADNRERETLQLFDLMFKLILKEASPAALVRFINGLFGKDYPPESGAAFAATESVSGQAERLERNVAGDGGISGDREEGGAFERGRRGDDTGTCGANV